MNKWLYDAAIAGDVTALSQQLQNDPHVLDKASLDCVDKNPLHLAAMFGHVDFVNSILQVHHSAKYMCMSRDREGRNPVHLAAMYGKLDVLEVLIQAAHEAAMEKTDGGGTILHLCVKYNQQAALVMLLHTLKDPEFIKAKNEDGMTILHLAISYDQYQTIKYLLDGPRILARVNNANGDTVSELLLAKDPDDSRMSRSNIRVEAIIRQEWRSRRLEYIEKGRDAMMVVASLIATMAFQAGVSPPGGVWQDDLKDGPSPHRAGEAVMAQTHPKYYRHMVRANTFAFVASLSAIILLFHGDVTRSRNIVPLLGLIMWVAVATIAMTYGVSLATVAPKDIIGQLSETSIIVLTVLMVWSVWIIRMLYKFCIAISDKCFN